MITGDTIQENRVQANYKFIKTLVDALKEKNSFYYPFNNLRNFISVTKSNDNKFRVFTWFTRFDDGAYRYFGAIQMNNPKELELYPLLDNTQTLSKLPNLNDTTLSTNKWLGAVYYQVIPVTGIRDPYFILLGWKGKSSLSSSKVIETLSFVDGKPIFGAAVLEAEVKSKNFVNRMIFDYTKNASMMLRYLKSENLIVFDHLVAPDKQSEGMTEFYAPDLSYDGLKFKQGKWIFQENLKLANLPVEDDELFIDPAKDSQNTAPVINQAN
ncbi:MAG TPA: hypothetical protein VFM79_12990 [Pelobium sp.]|nr:hypothetical protein [Pelobium sp.]